ILSAEQDGYRLFGGETTSEKAGGNLTHSGTSCERERAGVFSRREARLSPGFCGKEMAYAATSSSVISSNSSSAATRSARSSLRMEVTRIVSVFTPLYSEC